MIIDYVSGRSDARLTEDMVRGLEHNKSRGLDAVQVSVDTVITDILRTRGDIVAWYYYNSVDTRKINIDRYNATMHNLITYDSGWYNYSQYHTTIELWVFRKNTTDSFYAGERMTIPTAFLWNYPIFNLPDELEYDESDWVESNVEWQASSYEDDEEDDNEPEPEVFRRLIEENWNRRVSRIEYNYRDGELANIKFKLED